MQTVPSLSLGTYHERRLAFIGALHLAGFFADRGDVSQATELARRIEAVWGNVLQGDDRKSAVGRWQVSLAQTYAAIGHLDQASTMLNAAWVISGAIGDEDLAQQVIHARFDVEVDMLQVLLPENRDLIRCDALSLCFRYRGDP